uniref:tRNA uridine 5-carboxymethylaminomethyl modification enzyme MnmG n=2 Tax=Lygus hesperus TaxID=30085 RepID=A0A0A9X6N2_LYGHE
MATLLAKHSELRDVVLRSLRVFFIVEYSLYIGESNDGASVSWTQLPINSLLQQCDDLLHLQPPFFSYFLSPESILSVVLQVEQHSLRQPSGCATPTLAPRLTQCGAPQLLGPASHTTALVDTAVCPSVPQTPSTLLPSPHHQLQSPQTPHSHTFISTVKQQLVEAVDIIQSLGSNILKNIAYIAAVRETQVNFHVYNHFPLFSSHLLDSFQSLISLLKILQNTVQTVQLHPQNMLVYSPSNNNNDRQTAAPYEPLTPSTTSQHHPYFVHEGCSSTHPSSVPEHTLHTVCATLKQQLEQNPLYVSTLIAMYVNPSYITVQSHEQIQRIELTTLEPVVLHHTSDDESATALLQLFDTQTWIVIRLQILWKEQRRQHQLIHHYIWNRIGGGTVNPHSPISTHLQNAYDCFFQSNTLSLQSQFPLTFVPDIVVENSTVGPAAAVLTSTASSASIK